MTAESKDDNSGDSVTWREWGSGIVITNLILIGLEYMVYQALAPLERGAPNGGSVWTPIAIVYELFGFDAAMSVIPILWLLLMTIIGWQTCVRFKYERMNPGNTKDNGK